MNLIIDNNNGSKSYCSLARVFSKQTPTHLGRYTPITGTLHFEGEACRSVAQRLGTLSFNDVSEIEEFLLHTQMLRDAMKINEIMKARLLEAD